MEDPPAALGAQEEPQEEPLEEQQGLLEKSRSGRLRACFGRRAVGAATAALLVGAALLALAVASSRSTADRVANLADGIEGKAQADEHGKQPSPFMRAIAHAQKKAQKKAHKAKMKAIEGEVLDEDDVIDAEEDDRPEAIAQCVTNLNLAAWKLVQAGAVMTEATQNCPRGFYNADNKIGCMINLAAIVASTSAAASFFASSAFLCPNDAFNPDAVCITVLAALMETMATYPASEGQMFLFCPKMSHKKPPVMVYEASRRLGAPAVPAAPTQVSEAGRRLNADSQGREIGQDSVLVAGIDYGGGSTLPVNGDMLEQVFCTWQIAQTLWFFARVGTLIPIVHEVCPANERAGLTAAGCSEAVNEIITQFFNAFKFIAAASVTCVEGTDVKAGCALGALNFLSAVSQTAGVTSSLANGACSNLIDQKMEYMNPNMTKPENFTKLKKREMLETDLHEIAKAKHSAAHRLWSENKLTKGAWQTAVAEEAHDMELEQKAARLPSNATMVDVLRSHGINLTATPRATLRRHLAEMRRQQKELENVDMDKVFAQFREWERAYHP